MFRWLFGSNKNNGEVAKAKSELDSILSCAKFIIDNGELVHDNSSGRSIPSASFKDGKGNTLRISWFFSTGDVRGVEINGRNAPPDYDKKILRMAEKRIAELQKKHLEEVIRSVKH